MINVCLMAVGKEHGFGFNKESLFYRGLSLELTCSQHPEERVRPFQRSSNLPLLFPTTIIMGWYGWICLGSANKTLCFWWANVGVFYTPVQACGVYVDRQWCFYRRSWLVCKWNAESSLTKGSIKLALLLELGLCARWGEGFCLLPRPE